MYFSVPNNSVYDDRAKNVILSGFFRESHLHKVLVTWTLTCYDFRQYSAPMFSVVVDLTTEKFFLPSFRLPFILHILPCSVFFSCYRRYYLSTSNLLVYLSLISFCNSLVVLLSIPFSLLFKQFKLQYISVLISGVFVCHCANFGLRFSSQ